MNIIYTKDMRTRLASLIIVKQEPLQIDYLTGENETINYNDVVDTHFYNHTINRRSLNVGDLNNNSSINDSNNNENEVEDSKCMYYFFFRFILILYIFVILF